MRALFNYLTVVENKDEVGFDNRAKAATTIS